MCGKDDHRVFWNFIDVFDCDRAHCLDIGDNFGVVDDLVLYINGAPVALDGQFDDIDGQVDTGAKTPWVGEINVHMQVGPVRNVPPRGGDWRA